MEKFTTIIAHDYVLFKGKSPHGTREEVALQIPIHQARLLLEAILKEEHLQKEHTDKYINTDKDFFINYIIKSNGWSKSKEM